MNNNRIEQLQKLSDDAFISLALRTVQTIDNLMTRSGESSTNPYGFGGALSYGWDWPTANVYYPRRCARWRAILAEGKRRGMTSLKYTRYRKSKRGKIIYQRSEAVAA